MKYRRPFKGSGLTDVNLQPLKEYNITSAYGCYLESADGTPSANSGALGCFPDAYQWQSYLAPSPFTNYITGQGPQYLETADNVQVEQQKTVLLLEMASYVKVSATLIALILSIY